MFLEMTLQNSAPNGGVPVRKVVKCLAIDIRDYTGNSRSVDRALQRVVTPVQVLEWWLRITGVQ
jgi:P2-related tail formation protein